MWPPRKDAQDDLFELALSEAKRRGALPGKTEIVSPLYERDKENVEGGFYVEQGACMICSLPPETAPNLVRMRLDQCGQHKDSHCYFFRQPYSPEELELAVEALVGSCCEGLRYCGTDLEVIEKILKERPEAHSQIDLLATEGR